MPSYTLRIFTLNLVQAVCCSDHTHCCPAGMQCDLEHDICVSGMRQVPLLKKIAAVPNEGIPLFRKSNLRKFTPNGTRFGASFTSSSQPKFKMSLMLTC